MRPMTTSSSPSEQSVSLSAMSLTALSFKDMLDGREPTATSIILPKKSLEAVPGFPLFCKCNVYFFSLPLPSLQTSPGQAADFCCAEMQLELSASVY